MEFERYKIGGLLRISNGYYFGQIKKTGSRKWEAEIRESKSGNLHRFAGIWERQRDAIEEVEHILSRSPYSARSVALHTPSSNRY